MDGGEGDDYGGLQQPAGGYADAGVADAPADYGDVQNPPSPYDRNPKKPGAASAPLDLITQVEKDLKAVNRPLPQGVNLIDMKRHLNSAALSMFAAWTNSSQEIFINLQVFQDQMKDPAVGPKDVRAKVLISIWHEILHVIQ